MRPTTLTETSFTLATVALTSSLINIAHAQPTRHLKTLQLTPSPDLPPIASLGLTSYDFHQRALYRFSNNPNANSTSTSPSSTAATPSEDTTPPTEPAICTVQTSTFPDGAPTNARAADSIAARACIEYLYAAGSAPCSAEKRQPLCEVVDGAGRRSYVALAPVEFARVEVECREVAIALESIVDGCSEGDGWAMEGVAVGGSQVVYSGRKGIRVLVGGREERLGGVDEAMGEEEL